MYTIGNTENDNSSPHKLNPEQYRSSNNTNNIFCRELKTLTLRIFAFVSLAVKLPSLYPSNDERAERVDSNLDSRSYNFQIFVCNCRVIQRSVLVYLSCSCLRFEPSKIHAQMFRFYMYIFFLLNDMLIMADKRE